MKLRLIVAAVLVILTGSVYAKTETFSADSSDAADGKCKVAGVKNGTLTLSGGFGSGTATVRYLREGGSEATAADWVAGGTYTAATVQRIDNGNRRTMHVTLSGSTTPTLICSITKD